MTAVEKNAPPNISGKLTPVQTEAGGYMHIREDMDVAEALRYGQAALDAKDARIMTTTRGGRRFPTYESNPAIERERVNSDRRLRAEVELVLKGKQPDVVIHVDTAFEKPIPVVTKPVREKYPVQFGLRLLWVRFRDWFTPKLRLLHNWLRSL